MNNTDLLKQIAKAIATSARGVDPKVKIVSNKVVAGLGAAKLADDLILDKVPGLKRAMIWTDEKITQGQQWLVDNTLGKIPGVGPIISKLHKRGTDVRYKIRDALFGSNHPTWYENLPQHVPFNIPGSYNNKLVQFITSNGTKTAIPSVATIKLLRNIVTTPYATTSRYNEVYTAVKYARGLSYLPYSVNQMVFMFEIGNELSVLYYRMAKAVSAAFHYSLTKANVPMQIINGLGFNDIIDEYHNYVTLLDQMYNFMSVNMPLLPFMHKKLRQMCLFTALDSAKPAMSTYIQACVVVNKLLATKDGKGFYANSVAEPHTLAECKSLFDYYLQMLNANSNETLSYLLNVVADVKGSIATVEYVDNWRSITFESTFTDDTLFLNSIKNMDLLPTVAVVGKVGETDYGRVCDQFVNAWQGNESDPINVAGGKVQSTFIRMGSSMNIGVDGYTPNYVCCSGSKEIKPFVFGVQSTSSPYHINLLDDQYRFTNKLISLEGNENSEGAVLETVSLNYVTGECSLEAPTKTTPCYATFRVDASLFIGLHITVANGYDSGEVKTLMNYLSVPGWRVDTLLFGSITSWTIIDWMPAIRVTNFDSAATYSTAQLWDINGIGSLSLQAIETAIDYITYSLLYPGKVEALNKVELANKLISSLNYKK